jgi:hypothetical protein
MFPVAWRSEVVNKACIERHHRRRHEEANTADGERHHRGDASTTTADSAAARSAIDGACVWHGLYVRVGEVKHNGLVRWYANGHNVHHAKCGGGCRLYVWAVWHGMYVRVGEVNNEPVCDCRVTDPPRRPRKLFVDCEWSSVPTQTHTRSKAATCWSHTRAHAVRRRRVRHAGAGCKVRNGCFVGRAV